MNRVGGWVRHCGPLMGVGGGWVRHHGSLMGVGAGETSRVSE